MGKRSKEKRLAEVAGRRKQTIQLGGFGRRQQAPSYDTGEHYAEYNFSPRPSNVSGIQLLGSYQEGSDDESGIESPVAVGPSQNMSLPSAKQPERKMDDELAGFLAEINAIDTTSAATATKSKSSDVTVYDPLSFDPFTQANLLPAPWQAVLDESSGYHYYWNCETDEVQWEPPPAPTMQGCQLPEPPPPPLATEVMKENADGDKEESVTPGPSLEELKAAEEEEHRKAMAAKLAGLSKKERIKLLLQKNNMNVDEIPSEKSENEKLPEVNLTAKTSEGTDYSTAEKDIKKEKTEPEIKKTSALVLGYDSDASESGDSDEPASADEAVMSAKEKLPSKKDVWDDMGKETREDSKLSKEALADMQALFEEADNLVVFKTEEKSDTKLTEMETDEVEEKMEFDSFAVNDVAGMEAVSDGNEATAIETSEGEDEFINKDLCGEYDDVENEELTETNNCDMKEEGIEYVEDVEEPIASNKMDALETVSVITSEEADLKLTEKTTEEMETDDKKEKEREMEENEKDVQKEFSVDIFADESDHEHEKEEVESNAKEEEKKSKESLQAEKEDGSEDALQTRKGDEEKRTMLDDDDAAEKGEETNKDSDKEKKSRHKEKKKAKKEKKEKKHREKEKNIKDVDKDHKSHDKHRKDHERKQKDSERKRKEEKHDKRSKKSSERKQESSKSSRNSKEEVKAGGKSKGGKILTEEEKLKIEEKKRKAVLEEIEKEERRRSEYEKYKKEEKEKKEEEQRRLEREKKKKEEKKKEEEKLKEKEMHDFAEMLLEGALDGDRPCSEPGTEEKVEPPAEDDMEISENEENDVKPPLPPMPHPDDEPRLQEQKWPNENQDDKYYEELQTKITDLSLLLFDKLEFLEVSKKGLTNFQVMFIEMETRMNDWREGALDTEYLLYKLEEIDAEICKYEETAAPQGWSCHWSSEHGMYYYYCEKTGESTWSYPIVATPSQTDVPLAPAAYGTTYPGAENTGTPSAPTAAPLDDYGYGRSNMMMWRSDLFENESKEEQKSTSKKSSKSDPYRDPYRHLTGKKEEAKPSVPAEDTPLPPGEDEEALPNPGYRSGTSSPLPAAMVTAKTTTVHASVTAAPVTATLVAAAPIITPAAAAPPVASTVNPPQLQSDSNMASDESSGHFVVKAATTIPRVASDSVLIASHSLQAHSSASSASLAQNFAQPKIEKKKKEKRKKAVSSGLPSKKLKKVSSLVQKWQQVKQKVDEEMMEDSSEDEDPTVVSQKRIEEWKKAQLESGRAAYNPNFEEIKGDWREKIKKKQQ